MDFRLFIPITKVDVARRLVYGTIAEEIADRAGEIMDYASAKPMFQAWSSDIEKASNGKSVGNLRAMHGNVAAGKLQQIAFDDEARKIECCGKVVDDNEWRKVLDGVYTGFSMGGRYARRWQDTDQPHLMRYTPEPAEVSLVDNPCIPTATFEVLKEDGSCELRKFRQRDGKVAKIGARNSGADLARIQALHDLAVELGADCDGADESDDDDDNDTGDEIEKRVRGGLAKKLADFVRRLERMEAQPAAGGPVLNTKSIAKNSPSDFAGDPVKAFQKHLDTLPADQRALALMKFSLANPLATPPGIRER
jgi:hypothetical protein